MSGVRTDMNGREMRTVGIIYNPISGRGRSTRAAFSAGDDLRRYGLEVILLESRSSYEAGGPLEEFLASIDLLVICGGDGTLMELLPYCAQAETPIYMLPTGNESLFARRFSMSGSIDVLLDTVRHGEISRHYIGRVNGRPFFTMASLGLDSEVVENICCSRTGPLGYIGYVQPVIRQFIEHHPPEISLTVDGQVQLEKRQGFLIIANTDKYACRLRLVPEADSTQPCLFARFIPYSRPADYLRILFAVGRGGRALEAAGTLFCGRSFAVTSTAPYPVQADGEHVGRTPALVTLDDRQVRVLTRAGLNGQKGALWA